MKTLKRLEESKSFWVLFFILFTFFILRFPSLFEPNWYGDEGVYQVLGDAIRNGQLLYRDIWDNKPPLLYLIYSFLGSDQFNVRFASLIVGIFSIIAFFNLAKKIFNNFKVVYLSTAVFSLLFGLPLLEGNIANAENFMILPILLSALLIIGEPKKNLLFFLSGFLLGTAFLFKIVAVFDFAAFLLFLIFVDKNFFAKFKKKRYSTFFVEKVIFLLLGFLSPIFVAAIYFFLNGATAPFIKATFFSNISYVSYANKFLIPQGLLVLKLFILLFATSILFLKRKVLPSPFLFIMLWFSFSLFNAFFSQRPYTHYLLVLLPSFCLLIGFLFDLPAGKADKKFQKLSAYVLAASLVLILANFSFYGKTIFYYQNFISFLMHKKSVYNYQRFFDRKTPTDYQLAQFIKLKTGPSDEVFIWGNNAQVYKLAEKLPIGKYTVAYHVTSSKDALEETRKDIVEKKPKFIIIMPYMDSVPFTLSSYYQKIFINDVSVYERAL